MKKICVIIGSIALASCQTIGSPSSLANSTSLDEQIGIEAETSYSAFALAVHIADQSGLVHGDTARKLADLDNRLYALVQVERKAYLVANASDYNSAVKQINTLVLQGLALIPTKGK